MSNDPPLDVPAEPASIDQRTIDRYAAAGFGKPVGSRLPAGVADHRRAVPHRRHAADAVRAGRRGVPDQLRRGRLGRCEEHRHAPRGCSAPEDWPVLYPHVAPKRSPTTPAGSAPRCPGIMSVPEHGYDFVQEVAPAEGDVLVPKRHPSAFFGTPLTSYLVDAGVDSLVVTGCTTSGCVRSSVADAFSYNFRVAVPNDAVYDRSPVVHEVNLFDMAQKYADVASTADVLAALEPIEDPLLTDCRRRRGGRRRRRLRAGRGARRRRGRRQRRRTGEAGPPRRQHRAVHRFHPGGGQQVPARGRDRGLRQS